MMKNLPQGMSGINIENGASNLQLVMKLADKSCIVRQQQLKNFNMRSVQGQCLI